jgi:hypothetical protein
VTALKRAAEAGEPVDLATLHESFETLRDATEQPGRLFALAVEEARLLDAVVEGGAKGEAGEALVRALVRVLEGPATGTDPDEVRWACERMEAALRGAIGRALGDHGHVRALAALAAGYVRIGELDHARRAAARQVRQAEKFEGDDQGEAKAAALSLAFELAVEARDFADALTWARARVETLRAHAEVVQPEQLAAALEPLWRLYLEAGRPERALESARAWLEAEQRVALAAGPARRARLLDALAAVAAAVRLAEGGEAWVQAAEAWAEQARAEERAAAGEERPFATARLANALAGLCEAYQHERGPEAALSMAREWLEVARATGGASDVVGPLYAAAVAASALRAWPQAGKHAEEALALVGEVERRGRTREDPEQAWLRAALLWLATEAHFGSGEFARAVERGRALLARWQADPAVAQGIGVPPGAVIVLVAQAEEVLLPARPGAPRTRAVKGLIARARTLDAAIEALPRAHREPTARAAALAWRARGEWLAGSATLARRHATEAQAKLKRVTDIPRAVLAYVTYVDEQTRAARPRRGGEMGEALALSSRALAAAEAGHDARAAALLGALDPDALGEAPDALAHTLAACVRVLSRLAPDDPLLTEGARAWRELAPFALLRSALGVG